MIPDASHLLVVARFLDGKVVKGTTRDFSPHKPIFHLHPEEDARGEAIRVTVSSLKAVFFVKSLDGDPDHVDAKDFKGGQAQGRRVRVRFKDGEVIVGSTVGYASDRPGFFLIPADPQSNNSRAYVVASSVAKVEFLPMAQALPTRK